MSICEANESYNYTTKKCDKNSLNCSAGYFFNATSQKCELIVCPQGQLYDPLTNGCLDANNNTVSMCPPQRPFWNSTSIRCQACPASAPVYNKVFNRCEKCASNQAYNETLGQCQDRCPAGEHWDASTSSCLHDPCTGQDSFYHPTQKQCVQCPANTHPDLATYTCLSCPNGTSYNYNTKLCDVLTPSCPSGQLYNRTSGRCEVVAYMTSPAASNLIYAYPIGEYEKQYRAAKAANPSIQDCPTATPYFDQNSKKCVACTSSHPYFNLHTNLCQSCGSEGYDSEARKCRSSELTLDPTLERLIMNII